MLIVGANGHAKDMLETLREKDEVLPLYFFDNISTSNNLSFYGYPIINNFKDATNLFRLDNRFSMGIGRPLNRFELTIKFINLGGVPTSVISKRSLIAEDSQVGAGVNVMPFVSIYNDTIIGKGTLVNSYASVHHDSQVGNYCEISPGARILGGCLVGDLCAIGTNAVILPRTSICENVIVGAGSIVTKNIDEPGVYYGVPAKRLG